MIDLSTLQIPDVSVVPEPTAEDWEIWKQTAINWRWGRIAVSLARRCRQLEAEVERLRSHKCPHDLARDFSKETTNGY